MMVKIKQIWLWMNKPTSLTFILGAVFGSLVTGLATTILYWPWLKDYQGIAGAVLALGVAVWTIRLTILHREEDRFADDYPGLVQLIHRLEESDVRDFPEHPADLVQGLPSGAAWDMKYLALIYKEIDEQNEPHNEDVARHIDRKDVALAMELTEIKAPANRAASALADWFLDCQSAKRYVEYRQTENLIDCRDNLVVWLRKWADLRVAN